MLGFNPVCAVQISDVNGVPAVEKRFQIDKVFECEFAALFRQEVKQLQSINHHKLQMIFSVNLDTFSLFTGYMELGNLHEFIRVNSGGQLNRTQLPAASRIQWKLRHQILIDVLEAVAFLHSKNLVHGNLKSNNILLCLSSNRKMRAKVSDYCMNRLYQFVTSKKELIEQFSPYDSPEILDFSNESATKTDLICEASDAYAFGVVGWEVALMSSPEAAMRSVLHMVLSHSSSVYSSNHKDTFSSMLIHNQTTRSSAALDQKKPSPKSSVSSNHNLIIPDTLIPILFALLDKEPTQRPSFKVVLDELNLREKQISSFGNSAIFSSSTSSFSKEQYSSLSSIGPVSSVPQRTNTASENHTRESGIANAGYVTNILSGCFGCR